MLYEIHMLKNYPPVNLNRDDTGSPKTCFFGGVQRGRISSQCLKRTWRTSELYEKLLGTSGIRTRALPELLRAELKKRECEDAFIEAAVKKASGLANKDGKESKDGKENKDGITTQIIFYSPQDIIAVADVMMNEFEKAGSVEKFSKAAAKEIASKFSDVNNRQITTDIALFGRMVTSDAFRNVEAAMQVSHAFSTNRVNQESDYYTAVDDLLAGSDVGGAAMIGDIDFNSCCFYHYAAIDTDILRENLKDAEDYEVTEQILLEAMIQIMAFTNPGGKQNTFAGHILPSLLCVEAKQTKIPISYANAYAKPVYSKNGEIIGESIDRLTKEINKLDTNFGVETERLWFCPDGNDAPDKAIVCKSLNDLCTQCKSIGRK